MRVELPILLARAEAEAQRRGLTVRGSRAYPDESGWLGRIRVTATGELIEELPRGRRRRKRECSSIPSRSAGDMLEAVEANLAAAVEAIGQ